MTQATAYNCSLGKKRSCTSRVLHCESLESHPTIPGGKEGVRLWVATFVATEEEIMEIKGIA
jgi:hypothetical protein